MRCKGKSREVLRKCFLSPSSLPSAVFSLAPTCLYKFFKSYTNIKKETRPRLANTSRFWNAICAISCINQMRQIWVVLKGGVFTACFISPIFSQQSWKVMEWGDQYKHCAENIKGQFNQWDKLCLPKTSMSATMRCWHQKNPKKKLLHKYHQKPKEEFESLDQRAPPISASPCRKNYGPWLQNKLKAYQVALKCNIVV